MNYYIKLTHDMGRGIFANFDINEGETICYCELLVLSENDTKIVNSTDLQYYTFKYNDTQDCLVLGDGEIFNHDDNSSVAYGLVEISDSIGSRTLMMFTAKRDIKQGEQLFINYNDDIKVNTDSYTVNLV